jgi:hypothetical protein
MFPNLLIGYGYGLRKDLYSSLGSGIVSKVGTDFTTVLKVI